MAIKKAYQGYPLQPEMGTCCYCGILGCYPFRHDGIETKDEAIRAATAMVMRPGNETPRAVQLAEFVLKLLKPS